MKLTIPELLKLNRMGENTPTSNVNSVEGLVALLKDVNIENKPVCEVGSWLGVSTQTILNFNPSKLISVDVWGIDPNYGESDWANLPVSDVEKRFRQAMADYSNVEIIKNFSVKAAETIPDNSLYFVYIDANHSRPEVMADIHAWLPKVQEGGYIAGHDFCLYDVIYAVKDSFITEPRLQGMKLISEFAPQNIPCVYSECGRLKIYSDSSWCIKL